MGSISQTSVEGLIRQTRHDAYACLDTDLYRREVLSGLSALIGVDGALFRPGSKWAGSSAVYLDEDPRFTDGYVRKADVYRPDVSLWCSLSKGDKAFIDTEIYTASERRKKALYADVIQPCGVRSILGAPVSHAGEVKGLFIFYRSGRGSLLKNDHALAINPILKALALAEVTLSGPRQANAAKDVLASLPPRHHGVFRNLLSGMNERENAASLGLSERTVHKYTEQIFRALGARNRADFMARFIVKPLP